MKVFFLLISLSSFTTFAGVTLISDLDDTIKITNVANKPRATYNGIFGRRVFAGMPEFFEEARKYASELHVVSASFKIIRPSVIKTLELHGIEAESITLRNPLLRGGKISYKLRAISRIIDSGVDDIVLIGDDVDKDPEIFVEIQRRYPGRILASYIHVIRNRPLPEGEGLETYYTAADLALREFLAGRMDLESTSRIFERLILDESLFNVIPGFAHCPSESTIWDWQLGTVFSEEASRLVDRIIQHCTPSPKS